MIYLLIFTLLFILELFYFKVADKYNIIDKPNQRSSHACITLRGGGIVFYLGVLIYAFLYGFNYPWFLLGLTLICGVSFMDDINSISSKVRIVIHIVALLLMFYQWGLYIGFSWWYILLAMILCVGIINVYNFMDGINGMTGGYSLILTLTLLYINLEIVQFIDSSFLNVIILSLIVFNIFNFRVKAKCFAGDIGSIGIAFILVFVLGVLILKTNNMYWVILLSVYGVDGVLTIIHRLILWENIFQPHRKHTYQIMVNELKFSHTKVSIFYIGVQGLINLGSIYMYNNEYKWLYLLCVIGLLCYGYISFKWQINNRTNI